MVHENNGLLHVSEVAQKIRDLFGKETFSEEFVHQKTHLGRFQQTIFDRKYHLFNGILFVKNDRRGLGRNGQLIAVFVGKEALIGNTDCGFRETANNESPTGFHLGITDHGLAFRLVGSVAII